MNKKQTIRLNESQLKRVVADAVKRVLNENEEYYNLLRNPYRPVTTAYWKIKHPEWSDEQCKQASLVASEVLDGRNKEQQDNQIDPDTLPYRRNTVAHWKIRHPEWSDEKCSAAAERFSNYEKQTINK